MRVTQPKQGFTLIELLIVISLLSLTGLLILGMQVIIGQNQVSAWKNYLNIDEANSIVSAMQRELINARPGDDGAYLLATAQDNNITFYSDIDFDGKTDKVNYSLTGSVLSKSVTVPTGVPITYPVESTKTFILSSNVRNAGQAVFSYYNSGWPEDVINNPLTLENRIANTKMVKIALKFNINDNDPNKDYAIENNIKIRMLEKQ